jgi:TrmH family RNA methyltransferase
MTVDAGSNPLSGIVFVLYQPLDVQNVGAVVRLLGNFGLSSLRLVEPAAFDADRIHRMARRGAAVAAGIQRYDSLGDALADCGLVVGTTRRQRALERPVLTPRDAARLLLFGAGVARLASDEPPPARAAVLFGPEDFGLPNSALDRCHAIVTIPTVPHDASLNLAQAALLVAYELHIAATEQPTLELPLVSGTSGTGAEALALGDELEGLFDAARRMLQTLHEAAIEGRTNAALARIRAMILRSIPRRDEVALLTTVFEHVARELPFGRIANRANKSVEDQ